MKCNDKLQKANLDIHLNSGKNEKNGKSYWLEYTLVCVVCDAILERNVEGIQPSFSSTDILGKKNDVIVKLGNYSSKALVVKHIILLF